ncbi:MAG: CAP domain-containing protein, partial [Acidobacteria bacterium]|nr:CAP domain-containing protein [Acidobacteriota bacterium]
RYFSHISPDGREPFEVIEDRGYDFREAGENLAAGFASAKLVVAAWMRSPGHRDNLLSPSFEAVGVAICDDAPTEDMRGHTFVALYGAE